VYEERKSAASSSYSTFYTDVSEYQWISGMRTPHYVRYSSPLKSTVCLAECRVEYILCLLYSSGDMPRLQILQ
jgi:hypothetical protein